MTPYVLAAARTGPAARCKQAGVCAARGRERWGFDGDAGPSGIDRAQLSRNSPAELPRAKQSQAPAVQASRGAACALATPYPTETPGTTQTGHHFSVSQRRTGAAGCGEFRSVAPADLGGAGPNPALAGMEVAVARVPMNYHHPTHPHTPPCKKKGRWLKTLISVGNKQRPAGRGWSTPLKGTTLGI